MAYTITKSDGKPAYGIQEFTVDKRSDITTLPVVKTGSVAFCIQDSSVWMINSEGIWKEI